MDGLSKSLHKCLDYFISCDLLFKGVSKHVKLKCKCHGVSGSCSMRTCWRAMQEFAVVGDFLKMKFDKARLVEMNQDATGLSPLKKPDRHVRKSDIVYMEQSPDYCSYNPSTGASHWSLI